MNFAAAPAKGRGRGEGISCSGTPSLRHRIHLRLFSLCVDAAYLLFLVVLIPWILYLVVVRRRGVGSLRERFGFISLERANPAAPRRRLWIHAVSVGEFEAALPLLAALEDGDPHLDVVVSTTTTSAQRVARTKSAQRSVFLFPLDLGGCMRRALRRIQPSAVVLMELEVWPNLVLNADLLGIPVVVVNGRVSEEGFRRMSRFGPLLRPFFRRLARVLVQNHEIQARLETLGVARNRLRVVGNLKYDREPLTDAAGTREHFARDWGYSGGLCWIAGCTHPGEEEMVLRVHTELRRRFPDLTLILAPRHVERTDSVVRSVRGAGLSPELLSQGRAAGRAKPVRPDVIVVDTTGELARLYACGDVAFVGGSLVPRGGHNILEPILAGTATLHGPYMSNFSEVVGIFTEGGATERVVDERDLGVRVAAWLDAPEEREIRARLGLVLAEQNRGAATISVSEIRGLCGGGGSTGKVDSR